MQVNILHEQPSDLEISLISPSGTRSELVSPRSQKSEEVFLHFPFKSVWKMILIDIQKFSLLFHLPNRTLSIPVVSLTQGSILS